MELKQHSPTVHLPVARATVQSPVTNTTVQSLVTSTTVQSSSRLTRVLRFFVVTYLLGLVILSVEQFLALPSNLTSVDFWNVLFIPICWLYLIRIRQPVRFPYALGMWLILLGSFIGTFSALNPLASFIFISKEVYIYIWFVSLVTIFASLEPSTLRRILIVWLVVALLHGVVLVAEFVSPNFYEFFISFLGSIGRVDVRYIGRPAGFFDNPVWAALFQLMSFVPLLLVGFRRQVTLLLGMVLLLSILATASLGALTSLLGASVVAVIILLLMGSHLKFLLWLATVITVGAGLFLFSINQFPRVLASLEHLTTDRAAHTSGERLHLWEGGLDVLFSPNSILGVGPDNYRDFLENKTLHNDTLEFGVERGVIGLLGLALFAVEALSNAAKILLKQIKSGDTARPSGVLFLAMLFGIFLESNAHQIFHFRSVWMGLALLEATYYTVVFSPLKAAFAKPDKASEISPKSLPLSDRNHIPVEIK